MSIRNNNQQFIAKKPYCKVCHDAGKSESEYTNHYVRSSPDRNGNTNILCPTLLATECRFCYKLGHTTKFCPVIADRKKYEAKTVRQVKFNEKTKKDNNENKNKKNLVSGFSAIYISDSEEDFTLKTQKVNKNVIVDEFPALCSVKIDKPIITGYAAMVAKPISAKVVSASVSAKVTEESKWKKQTVIPRMKKEFHVKKSWADWSDSSDGEDADEDEEDNKNIFDDHDDCVEFPSFIDNETTYYQDCN